MRKFLVRSREFSVRSWKLRVEISGAGACTQRFFTLNSLLRTHGLLVLFLALAFSGCVRVAGGAGYWRTGPEEDTTAKRASFDTADFTPAAPPPGKIAV